MPVGYIEAGQDEGVEAGLAETESVSANEIEVDVKTAQVPPGQRFNNHHSKIYTVPNRNNNNLLQDLTDNEDDTEHQEHFQISIILIAKPTAWQYFGRGAMKEGPGVT